MPFDKDGNWRPNIKQEKFLAIPTTIKEAGYLGGAGSGKSEILLMMAIAMGWYENPRFKQVFMRRSFPELRNEIVPRSRDIYTKFGASFNKSDMAWTFPSGAMVFLGHCESDKDVSKYDSMEINLFTPDEVTSLTEYMYLYIGFTRVRTSDKTLPAIIRCAGMPGGIGHSWVKKRFIDPCKEGGKVLIGRGGNKRMVVVATLVDNVNHIDPEYTRSLDALPEAERQAKKFGSWDAYSGQVFSEFRELHYPDEPDNAIHVVQPFEIPSWWPKIVAIDWGMKAMCSVGFAAISPDGHVYVYRHLMFFGKKIEEWAPEVKYFIDKENPQDVIICHSANQNRGEPHTIYELVSNGLDVPVRLGEKNRIAGKMLVHQYLRWEPVITPADDVAGFDNTLAEWILRNKGLVDYHKYLASFEREQKKEVLPVLQFFDTPEVRVICDAIKSCTYEKTGMDGKKKEDVAEFDGDDPYDMLRMLLHSCDAFFETSSSIQANLQRTSEVIEKLQVTGDMTTYYRQMARLEAGNKVQAVSRFHRGVQ